MSVPDNALCFYGDGNKLCCVFGDFVNLQESPAGFGDDFGEAVENLRQECNGRQATLSDTRSRILNAAERSVLDELHELLDSALVDGTTDVRDIQSDGLSTLGATLHGVMSRAQHLTERLHHYHKGPDRICETCGLDMTDAIHKRA